MELYLNYLPSEFFSSESGVTKDSYLSAIAGTLPLRQFFATKSPPHQSKHAPKAIQIDEQREEYDSEKESEQPSPGSEPENNSNKSAKDQPELEPVQEQEAAPEQEVILEEAEESPATQVGAGGKEREKPKLRKKKSPTLELDVGEGPISEESKELRRRKREPLNTSDENELIQDAKFIGDALNPQSRKQSPRTKHRLTQRNAATISVDVGQVDLPPTPSSQPKSALRTTFGRRAEAGTEERAGSRIPMAAEQEGELIFGREDIEKTLRDTEELLVMYESQPDPEAGRTENVRKELSRRIYENMERAVAILGGKMIGWRPSEQTLVRLAEIGKKYLEGPIQAKLLRAILEEYRRVQEDKIIRLEEEKHSIETSQKLGQRYTLMQTLLNVFPEDLLRELEDLRQAAVERVDHPAVEEQSEASAISEESSSVSSVAEVPKLKAKKRLTKDAGTARRAAIPQTKSRGKQPRETPRQRMAQTQVLKLKNAAWDVKRKPEPKSRPHLGAGMGPRQASMAVVSKGKLKSGAGMSRTPTAAKGKGRVLPPQQSMKALHSDEQDAWIGVKSTELENEELWERDAALHI